MKNKIGTALFLMAAAVYVTAVVTDITGASMLPELEDRNIERQEILPGTLRNVVDGDTIICEIVSVPCGVVLKTLRFLGVDAPEHDQPYGPEAQRFVQDQLNGQTVFVRFTPHRTYERYVAEIFLPSGESLSKLLLEQGLAWYFVPKGQRANGELKAAADMAKAKKIGLWADENPIAPWDWRKGKRKN